MKTISLKDMAQRLNGRAYLSEVTREDIELAKANRYVIVFGGSDDLMEVCGAIDDEFGCYNGHTFYFSLADKQILDFQKHSSDIPLIAQWCATPEYAWTYDTTIPHETFVIVDDGELYCKGIIFDLDSLLPA